MRTTTRLRAIFALALALAPVSLGLAAPTTSSDQATDAPLIAPLICHDCEPRDERPPPPPPTGTISASPNPCTFAVGAGTCTARIDWTSSVSNAEVWVTDLAGHHPALFARANNAWQDAPWIQATGARFHLKAGGWTSTTLATVDVHGTPQSPAVTVTVTRRYTYNAHQELCRSDEPETGSTFLEYDGAGNLSWSAAGFEVATIGPGCASAQTVAPRRVDRSHDTRNRVRTLRFPDGRGDADYAWTQDGLLSSIAADNDGHRVVSTYAYNNRRLLTQEVLSHDGLHWPIAYRYNANGHLASQTWNGLSVDYVPNGLGQPTRVGAYASAIRHHPNGALAGFTYGNGIVHAQSLNARGLPDTRTDSHGAVAIVDDGHDYDANGNVAAITDGATGRHQRGNRTMAYDGLDRLVAVDSPMFGNARYAYDALDNITRTSIGGPTARDHWYCHDDRNRLTNIKTGGCGGASVSGLGYDAQGNLANKDGVAYDFDYGNRLRSVVAPTGESTYAYDGHGRRVRDTTPAGTRHSHYTLDGRLATTVDARTGKSADHIHLGDRLIAIRERDTATGATTTTYQHTDALGTPVATTDANRNVVERSEYEPYGKLINRPMGDGPGFTGHVGDSATGLVYAQQRYLEPGIPKFLSTDAVTAYATGDWRLLNRYAYANNNPYTFVDPDGRLPILIPIAIFVAKEIASEAVEQVTGVPMPTVKNAGKFAARQALREARAETLQQSARAGARRHNVTAEQLRAENPNKSVQNEQYLRDASGTIARDAKGSARRVDHVVIGNGSARTYETTSTTANKTKQTQKEIEILNRGGTFVRDRSTKELVPVDGLSEIRRVD